MIPGMWAQSIRALSECVEMRAPIETVSHPFMDRFPESQEWRTGCAILVKTISPA